MRKIGAFLIASLLAFSVAGCGNDNKPASAQYEKTQSKMENVENYSMVIQEKITLTKGDPQYNKDQTVELTTVRTKEDGILAQLEYVYDTMRIPVYYKDGYMYLDQLGDKTKYSAQPEDVLYLEITDIPNIPADAILEEKTESSGGLTKLIMQLDGDKVSSMLQELIQKDLTRLHMRDEETLQFTDVSITVVKNKNQTLKSMTISAHVAFESLLGEMEFDMLRTMEYTAIGKEVTLTLPDDLDSYTERVLPSPAPEETPAENASAPENTDTSMPAQEDGAEETTAPAE